MDRNVSIFYQRAVELRLPVTYLPEIDYLHIYLGKKNYYFRRGAPPLSNSSSIKAAANKYISNKILTEEGFPVPKAITFTKAVFDQEPLDELMKGLTFPLVLKPAQGTGRGDGVICNIKNVEVLRACLNDFFCQFANVQLEEFKQDLKEYRVLILKNAVIGVVERFGAYVIGDGRHSIKELIALKNELRDQLSSTLTISPLVYDKEYELCLHDQHLSLSDIPPLHKKVRLSYTVNTGRGGEIISRGKKIHPHNAKMLQRAMKALGLEYVAMDVLCQDINAPFMPGKWFILETNPWGDTTIHETPNEGEKTPAVKKVLKHLIRKHPFSYLHHLAMRSELAIYFKIIMAVGLLFLIPWLYKLSLLFVF
jgi:cyanophycin synthetase